MSLLQPLSKTGTGASWLWQDGLGSWYHPSFAPGHSWAVSMALKGPQLGLGRTAGMERREGDA
jgi:hypothetical protein